MECCEEYFDLRGTRYEGNGKKLHIDEISDLYS